MSSKMSSENELKMKLSYYIFRNETITWNETITFSENEEKFGKGVVKIK